MEQVKNNQKSALKVLKIVGNVLFYAVITMLLIYSLIVITSRGEKSVPNLFGNGFLAVESDSMTGAKKDSFEKNDLIFVKILNESQKEELVVGDIITFFDPAINALNTHRIIRIDAEGVWTKGDKEGLGVDPFPAQPNDTIAKYQGKAQGLGGFVLFLQSQLGFGLIVLLPIFLVLIYQGFVVVSAVFAIKKEKLAKEYEAKKELDKLELELEKERMKKELLEELKKEQK